MNAPRHYGLQAPYSYGLKATGHRRALILEEALTISRELGDKKEIAGSVSTLGATAYGQGDYAAAESFLTESVLLLEELDDKHGLGWAYAYLGDLFAVQHNGEQAQEH